MSNLLALFARIILLAPIQERFTAKISFIIEHIAKIQLE